MSLAIVKNEELFIMSDYRNGTWNDRNDINENSDAAGYWVGIRGSLNAVKYTYLTGDTSNASPVNSKAVLFSKLFIYEIGTGPLDNKNMASFDKTMLIVNPIIHTKGATHVFGSDCNIDRQARFLLSLGHHPEKIMKALAKQYEYRSNDVECYSLETILMTSGETKLDNLNNIRKMFRETVPEGF